MYKAQFGASMDTSGQKDMEGVTGVTVKGTVSHERLRRAGRRSTPPAEREVVRQFMNQLFGGMMGGSGMTF